jgi:hypothetical protein
MAVGLFRTPENWVVVNHGSRRALMQRDTYRLTGIEPRFDRLPTEDEYEIANGRAKTPRRAKDLRRVSPGDDR